MKIRVHELAQQSYEVYEGKVSEILPQLYKAGGSPGGARPKILVGYNRASEDIISGENDLPEGFEHWIVKFSAREDATDAGPVEYAYSLMAKCAGIDIPETHLFESGQGGGYFGVKRFDRSSKNRRYHIHTFGNMIHANFRIPSCDYADLLKVTSILTKNYEEVIRAFRLMVFNVKAHNRDDHAKNFSFILNEKTKNWSLSPAYDLTFANGPGGEHSTSIAGVGRNPIDNDLLKLAEQFDIEKKRAKNIIEEVCSALSSWNKFAGDAYVSPKIRKKISGKLQA